MKKLTFSIHVGPKQNSRTLFCAWLLLSEC